MTMERGDEQSYIIECLGPVDPELGTVGGLKITFDDAGEVTVQRPGCGWWWGPVERDAELPSGCPECGSLAAVRRLLSARDAAKAMGVAKGVPPSIAMGMMDVGPELPEEEDPV
jgi:hypothetical protein